MYAGDAANPITSGWMQEEDSREKPVPRDEEETAGISTFSLSFHAKGTKGTEDRLLMRGYKRSHAIQPSILGNL
jgi:hypothetical protein